MTRPIRIDDLTDDELSTFVLWCRFADDDILHMPDLVRAVLNGIPELRKSAPTAHGQATA